MDLCRYTEELWKLYTIGDMEYSSNRIFENMHDDIVIDVV